MFNSIDLDRIPMYKIVKLIGLITLPVLFIASCGGGERATDAAVEAEKKMTSAQNPPADDIDRSNPDWKQNLALPAMFSFEAGKTYYWDLVTNKGTMSFRLYHESAPMHASSTKFLTDVGFYDDVVFHRIIPGFMAQGGDPTGTGRGGPGYRYEGEFDGITSHDKPGLLSMANAGPGTDGSQFFITFVPTQYLDGKHTIFGEIVSGEETLAMLEAAGSRSGQTSEQVKIERAIIRVE
ncbi:MAG: peptidylprolyl isomerase [Pseudomonadales bacterium]|nr:peptidylprolyl isomerase [Pseudomonadales bacterium]